MKLSNLLFIFGITNFTDKINLFDNNINTDNYIPKIFFVTLLSLPIIYRNGEKCISDEDCPNIMKCCQIGNIKYCCTPNNYVKLEFSYIKNYVR